MNRNYSIGLLIILLGSLPFIPARWSPILSNAAGSDYSDVKIDTLEVRMLAFSSPEDNSVFLSEPVTIAAGSSRTFTDLVDMPVVTSTTTIFLGAGMGCTA